MLRGLTAGAPLKILLFALCVVATVSLALTWSPQSSRAADQQPVAAWSFDENTGETVEDLYGESDGTVEHAGWKKGRYGSALEFDGEESCVTVPNSATLQLREEFTLEAWVRPEATGEFDPVFFKEDAELNYGYALMAGGVEGGHPSGYVVDGTWPAPEIEATAELPVHVWSHLALTFDGAHIRLYVNGELIASGASEELVESHGSLRMGCGDNFGFWDYFEGRIDEPRIYERVLPPGEIAADMAAPLETPKSPPVAEYSFDQESETAVDFSGHKNEGAIEATEWIPSGRYGGALNFDGEESCVTVPDSETLHPSEEFTLEAWVKPKDSPTADPIIFKAGEGTAKYALALGFEHYGRPQGWVDGEELRGPSSIGTDVWTHLAFTYDGNTLRLYVNGEIVDSEVVGELSIQSEEAESEEPLYIGCDPPAWGDHFHGKIDERGSTTARSCRGKWPPTWKRRSRRRGRDRSRLMPSTKVEAKPSPT
jgi:hypothetical protein